MPFSLTETKESTLNYIDRSPLLCSLFFNPFVLCIVLVIIVMVIHYVFDKEYEEEESSNMTIVRHMITNYISIISVLIVHDILIKNKYRTKIKDLEKTVENLKQTPTSFSEVSDNSLYQKI